MHSVEILADQATQTPQGSSVRLQTAREQCSRPPRPAILSDAERGVNGGANSHVAHWTLITLGYWRWRTAADWTDEAHVDMISTS